MAMQLRLLRENWVIWLPFIHTHINAKKTATFKFQFSVSFKRIYVIVPNKTCIGKPFKFPGAIILTQFAFEWKTRSSKSKFNNVHRRSSKQNNQFFNCRYHASTKSKQAKKHWIVRRGRWPKSKTKEIWACCANFR